MFRAFVYIANFQVLHIWPNLISTQSVVHDLGPTIGIHGPCWTLLWFRTKLVRGSLARASLARWPWPPRASRAPVRWARNCRRLEFTRWLGWKLELPRWPRALRASFACFSSSLCLSLSTDANASRHSAEKAKLHISVSFQPQWYYKAQNKAKITSQPHSRAIENVWDPRKSKFNISAMKTHYFNIFATKKAVF